MLTRRFVWVLLAALITATTTATACSRVSDEDLFRRLLARADDGSGAVQYNLGMFYNNGIGVQQNPAEAFQWFQKAAAAGDPLGHYKVGCYYAGQFPGAVAVDAAKALSHKLTAAGAGYVLAQHDVALSLAEAGDFAGAAKWWQDASQQGDALGFFSLAEWHHKGQGVPVDLARAYEYLLIATRLVPESQAQKMRSTLEELKASLDAATARQVEDLAASWRSKKSELTLRAARGIEEARQLGM